jgi:Domain of unknown function (DUF4157)
MGKHAYARLQARRKSLTETDEKGSLFDTFRTPDWDMLPERNGPLPVQDAPPATEHADPMGHSFGQIAVEPAPDAAPQMKPRVSQPGDSHEREADQMADAVMRMPAAEAATSGDTTATSAATRQAGETGAIPDSDGQPLDMATRAYMEPRFGHNFGNVRVHTDEQAAQAASGYRARAYTLGSDIVFGAQEYAPETPAGRHLLAHELTHVVQQEGDTTAAAAVQREPEGGTKAPPTVAKGLSEGVQGYMEGADGGAADLEDEDLARSVMGFQHAILTGWKIALDNFLVVLESKSDKEASPDFQKAMGKFFLEKAVGKIGAVAKWAFGEISEKATKPVDLGLDALKALNEEVKRAEEAKESATLRDFYVQHNTSIGKMLQAVEAGTPTIVSRVGKIRDAMFRSTDTKKGKATEALSDAADKYTAMRMVLSDAYGETQGRLQFSTPENIFRLLTEEWIRGAMIKDGWSMKHASVVIRMNNDYSVKDAHIQGTGGQKIAEQLVKDAEAAHADGVNFYEMEVRKEIQYFGNDSSYPSAYVYLDENNSIHGYVRGDVDAAKVWEYIKSAGAKALTAKKVEGDG